MNDKFILLLNYYKREQRTLAKQLREALQEGDYRIAARIQKGQHVVAQQLQILRAFHNKHADELDRLDRWIDFAKKRIHTAPTEAEFHSETLKYYEQQKQRLLEASAVPVTATSVLKEVMLKLLSGQIASFSLTLNRSTRLRWSIRRVRRTAILTLPELIRHREERTIRKRHMRQLRNLGFAYYDQKDKLLAVEPLATAEDVERIMQLWMKITCVVFDFQEFGGDAEIRYFSA